MDEGHCDFCFARLDEHQRKYPCRDFKVQPLAGAPFMASVGSFLACVICAAMIDGENWTALLDRALDSFCTRHRIHDRETRAQLRESLADWQRMFREKRVPYDSDN